MIKFCRDCANFEDRRDIDNVGLCKNNSGPFVCCEEFEPIDEGLNEKRLYERFCLECNNFEDIKGISICAKDHSPGVGCGSFIERFDKLKIIRQNNQKKIVILEYMSRSDLKPFFPELLSEVSRKIKW